MVVGNRPQRSPDPGLVEEHRQAPDHDDGDHRSGDIDMLQDQQPAVADLERRRSGRQPQFGGDHLLGLAAEDEFAETDQEVGEPDGRHQQDDIGLVDQRPHHDALDQASARSPITPMVRISAR
jgi:hypothetical protein